jgi:uncharacterized protein (DUF433 family)
MIRLDRLTRSVEVMGGRVCVRGTRVTVGALVGLMAAGVPVVEILDAYPYLDEQDLQQAVAYAAWRASEVEVQISS